ncbi:MAG TPA: restriction endonuclease subunit S [Candidatus Woesebacteria bacterium]|nr:restriction endonuclease subunit S [Candidatus Woesebacteria bacterium]
MNTKNTPKLRFPEFSEEWQFKSLNKLAKKKLEKNKTKIDLPVLTNSATKGIVIQNEYFDKNIVNFESTDVYYIVDINDFIYNPRISNSAPVGPIKRNKLVKGLMSPLYTIFKLENIDTNFIEKYFDTSYWHKYIIHISNIGARHDRMNITDSDFFNLPIPFPETNEQKKIASLFTAIDEKISALQNKVELLKKYKKGVMQKIFSQKIRFKDENGKDYPKWEKKSIEDIFERITEKNKENNKNVLTISAQHGLINQEDFFNKSVAAKDLTNYYLLHKGDFAYNKSYSNGYPMGAIKKLNKYDKGIVSTLYICFRTKQNYSQDFFEQYFNTGLQNREIEKIAQEGARNHGLLNISVVDFFKSIFLQVPSYKEQKIIADFLTKIDDKIVLEERKLEQAKLFKKSLLQQMFV